MGRHIQKQELKEERLERQVRLLPTQLQRARARVRHLEQQAREWKLFDLVQDSAS